jgi:hypothetical protein
MDWFNKNYKDYTKIKRDDLAKNKDFNMQFKKIIQDSQSLFLYKGFNVPGMGALVCSRHFFSIL